MTRFFISPGDPSGIGPEITLKALSKNKKLTVYDMRNIYSPSKMKKQGVRYFGIGR